MAKNPTHVWVLWWPFLGAYVRTGGGGLRTFSARVNARAYAKYRASGSRVVKLAPQEPQ